MTLAASTICARKLSPAEQLAWIAQVREVCEISPLVRPLARGGQPMSVRITSAGRLGWVGAASGYRYAETDSFGNPWPAMPWEWVAFADEVAGEQPWDSAIVNWYDEGASLGFHADKSELDLDRPIVTISLGDPAMWAVRGSMESPISRVCLESGDVTLLAGPNRGALHSIERIIADPMGSPLGPKRGRISVTLRVAGDPS